MLPVSSGAAWDLGSGARWRRPRCEDLEMIRGRIEQLTDQHWQSRWVALRAAARQPRPAGQGAVQARQRPHPPVRGASTFHNRIDHGGGTGCALQAAERTVDWGGEGIIDWWCTEHEDAVSADQPVY